MKQIPHKVIFTAGSGRSGTTSLADLFRHNIKNCVAWHEPFIDPDKAGVDPSQLTDYRPGGKILEGAGFGRAIQWYDDDDPCLDLIIKHKARIIRKQECDVYLEANHAFLKSMCDGMVQEFPNLYLVHLTRHPVVVARSFVNRIRNPSVFEEGYRLWNVAPGMRKNCMPDPPHSATYIQYYVWQWLELELRLVRFLECHPEVEIIDIDVNNLSDVTAVMSMFRALDLHSFNGPTRIPSPANVNSKVTRVNEQDIEETHTLLNLVPSEIFARLRNPYDLEELRLTGKCSCREQA